MRDLLVHRRPETRLLASASRNHQHRVGDAAFYEGELFTVNMKELSETAALVPGLHKY